MMKKLSSSTAAAAPRIEADRARAVWRRCLASAVRTALACTIVGAATLYGPAALNRQVAFPAWSYVTVILVVTDATLGDTLRGCWLALQATVLGVCPAIVSLWLIGPGRLTTGTTSAAVAISAFVVALPENTHLISKRMALGQIVLVYVIAFINGGKTEPVMHPVHLAASTALGVAACVLALLLPYPSLAYCEVKENCKLYTGNASERLKLLMKAFSAEDKASPKALLSQAKSLNNTGNKLLQSIKSKQESMQWERIPLKFLKSYKQNPGEALQGLETILLGMENALSNCSQFPIGMLNSELKHDFNTLEEQILSRVKSMPLENAVLPQSDMEMDNKFLQTLHTNRTPIAFRDLPSLFFVFCLKLLHTKSSHANSPPKQQSKKNEHWFDSLIVINKRRLMPALKCSLSLGFAVFFGLVYSKENGFWSGLPVAISLASAREATFKVANIKAQGTVLGTVYGVVGCFVFERYVKIRFISLLPWFLFSSFLRQSRMYGQAGGVSAVIGALLILGRKNFGSPSEFAIDRIVETFIGLSCSIMVDILLQPTRASVLSKLQLSVTVRSLHESVDLLRLESINRSDLGESVRKLKSDVNLLGKFIEEAEAEPNFWFLPFHGACYSKLKTSLSKTADLLHFAAHALRLVDEHRQGLDSNKAWEEASGKMEADLEAVKEMVCSGMRCLEEVVLVNSIAAVEEEYGKADVDVEKGKAAGSGSVMAGDDGGGESTECLVRRLGEMEGENEAVMLDVSALVFCMDGVVKEGREIEKAVRELVQWENPSRQVDLHDILGKLHALKKTVN